MNAGWNDAMGAISGKNRSSTPDVIDDAAFSLGDDLNETSLWEAVEEQL